MNHNPSLKEIMNSIVPITRFNRGEANKIFDEVAKTGVKIVFKNNSPVGVLVEPGRYEAMVETLEDYSLWIEAEKRLKTADPKKTISHETALKTLGLDESELEDVDVDIE